MVILVWSLVIPRLSSRPSRHISAADIRAEGLVVSDLFRVAEGKIGSLLPGGDMLVEHAAKRL